MHIIFAFIMVQPAGNQKVGINNAVINTPNGPTTAGGTNGDHLIINSGVGNVPRINNISAINNGSNANIAAFTKDLSLGNNNNRICNKNNKKNRDNSNDVQSKATNANVNDDNGSFGSSSSSSVASSDSVGVFRYFLRNRGNICKNNSDALGGEKIPRLIAIDSDSDNDDDSESDGSGSDSDDDDDSNIDVAADLSFPAQQQQHQQVEVVFQNNLQFVCPIQHLPGRPCLFTCPLNKDKSKCLKHINSHSNNISDQLFCSELKDRYGFVRCPTCRKTFCGTKGFNIHYGKSHGGGNLVNDDNINNNYDIGIDDEAQAPDNYVKRSRLTLDFIRSNDKTIIHEISTLTIRILQICATAATTQDSVFLDKANEAFMLIPSIFAIIQAINKNRKLDEYRKRVVAYTSRLRDLDDDVAFIEAILDSYHNQYTVVFGKLVDLRKSMGRAEIDIITRTERFAAKQARNGKPRVSLRIYQDAQRMRREKENDAPITVYRSMSSNEMREYLLRKNLYPSRTDTLTEPLQRPEFEITPAEVCEVVQKLNKETSAGVSGWTNEFLKTLCDPSYNDQANGFLGSLTVILNMMIKNEFGSSYRWSASRLVFLPKPDSPDLRPIAIGEVIRRVLGKVTLRKFRDRIIEIMGELQYGVGMPGGCEVLAHKLRVLMKVIENSDIEDVDSSKQMSLIMIDLVNAFGEVSRDAMDKGVAKHLPQLHAVFRFLYGTATKVYHSDGEEVASVQTGACQGCVFAALCFCLGILDILKETQRDHPQVRLGFFIDDGSAMGERRHLIPAVTALQTRLATVGLVFNGPKSGFYVHPNSEISQDVVLGEVSIPRKDYFKVLGVPSGRLEDVEAAIDDKLRKAASPLEFIHQVPTDIGYILLRFCITARVMYLARNVPSSIIGERLAIFDNQVDLAISRMVGVTELSPRARRLRGFGVTFNGLGIVRLEDVNRYAFVSCFLSLIHYLQNVEDNLLLRAIDKFEADEDKWILPLPERKVTAYFLGSKYFQDPEELGGERLGAVDWRHMYKEIHLAKAIRIPRDEENNGNFDNGFRQKSLAMSVMKQSHASLVKTLADSGDMINAANIMCTPLSSAYVQCMLSGMSHALVYRLDSDEYVEMLRRKLTIDTCEAQGQSAMCSGCRKVFSHLLNDSTKVRRLATTALMEHTGSCAQVFGKLRWGKHNGLRDLVAKVVQKRNSAYVVTTEVGVEGYGTHNRMDIKVTLPQPGATRLIDVGYVAASSQSSRHSATRAPDIAIEAKQTFKQRSVDRTNLSQADKAGFVPFIVSSTGRVGPRAIEFMNELFEWNQRPRTFDSRVANERKHFIYSIGTLTERYAARCRIALRNNITWSDI